MQSTNEVWFDTQEIVTNKEIDMRKKISRKLVKPATRMYLLQQTRFLRFY